MSPVNLNVNPGPQVVVTLLSLISMSTCVTAKNGVFVNVGAGVNGINVAVGTFVGVSVGTGVSVSVSVGVIVSVGVVVSVAVGEVKAMAVRVATTEVSNWLGVGDGVGLAARVEKKLHEFTIRQAIVDTDIAIRRDLMFHLLGSQFG
jgi:hypothetical protein